jgi:hypothetical protein
MKPANERIGKYLSVEQSDHQPKGGKTTRWRVMSNHGDQLGTVAWFGRWRQYTFDPVPQSTFNRECLLDIAAYLERVNKEHRERRSA